MTQRAVVIARVSSSKQVEGASLADQESAGRAYAERLGMTVVEVFREEGVSGSALYRQRPAMARMLEMAERGEIDAVVWYSHDRQGRDGLEMSLIEHELGFYGVEPHFTTFGRIDTDSMEGVMTNGVGRTFAEAEKVAIKNRSARGRYGKALQGKWPSATPPYGYVRNANGDLVIVEDDAAKVRFAFKRLLAGDSIKKATTALNLEWPDHHGNRNAVGFSHSTVGSWLRNPTYAGRGVERWIAPEKPKTDHGGKRCGPFMSFSKSLGWHCTECRKCNHADAVEIEDKNGRRLRCPNCARERFVIHTDAIVTEEVFEDTQAMISKTVRTAQANRAKKSRDRTYALSGGRFLHLHAESGTEAKLTGFIRNGHRAYRCSHAIHRYKERFQARAEYDPCPGWGVAPRNGLPMTSTRAPHVEAFALLELLDVLETPEAIASLQAKEDRRAEAAGQTRTSLDSAKAERKALEAERLRRLDQEAKGRISEAELDGFLAEIAARHVVNEALIADLENEGEVLDRARLTISDLMSMTVKALDLTAITPDDAEVWEIAVNQLRNEARKVLEGDKRDLSPEAQAWLLDIVNRFDVRAVLAEENGDTVIRFTGDKDLFLNRNGVYRLGAERQSDGVIRARLGP